MKQSCKGLMEDTNICCLKIFQYMVIPHGNLNTSIYMWPCNKWAFTTNDNQLRQRIFFLQSLARAHASDDLIVSSNYIDSKLCTLICSQRRNILREFNGDGPNVSVWKGLHHYIHFFPSWLLNYRQTQATLYMGVLHIHEKNINNNDFKVFYFYFIS